MHSPKISIIAAIGKNRELGKKGNLIWRIPSDLARVKALTMGHPILMGRSTYASIGHPLPGRTNIVISKTVDQIEGCVLFTSFVEGLQYAQNIDPDEIFIFGGAQIYEVAIPFATRLYLTLIDDSDDDADVFFPPYDEFTRIVKKEEHPDATPAFSYITYERA